jgi:hypothetical protein
MVQNLLIKYLQADPSLAATRKMVGKFEQYEKSAPNSFPAQIAKQYGEGVHFMIPNTRGIGVGKKTKYCTVDEFKEHKMTFDNIDLSAVWSELGYFIEPVKVKNLFEFGEA